MSRQTTKTTVMKPRGGLYLFTVMSLAPRPATASPSMATTRGLASDQDVMAGLMGMECGVRLEERTVMLSKLMSTRWAPRAEKLESWA